MEGKDHEPKNVGLLKKLEKARKSTFSTGSRRNTVCQHAGFSSVRSVSDF